MTPIRGLRIPHAQHIQPDSDDEVHESREDLSDVGENFHPASALLGFRRGSDAIDPALVEGGREIRVWLMMGAALVLGGCNTYVGFAGADWPMPYNPTTTVYSNGKSVAITVQDKRPYIVSGDKAPTFIGLVRSPVGIPYNTTFEPAEVVAEKIKRDIAAEVSAQGYAIGQGEYTMDVVIREFKHDGYIQLTIFHNLEVTVSHEGQERTTTIEDKRSGTLDPPDRWSALLADYYSIMIRSIVATLKDN